jgi:hypothetical protein
MIGLAVGASAIEDGVSIPIPIALLHMSVVFWN